MSLDTVPVFCIAIADLGGRCKHSPWFRSSDEAQAWLDDPETKEDHHFRFLAPTYRLQTSQVIGGELVVVDERPIERSA